MPLCTVGNLVLKDGRELEVRSPNADDVANLKVFLRKIAEETTHTMQYVGRELPSDEIFAGRYEAAADDPLTLYICVFDQGRPVAMSSIRSCNASDHIWTKHMATFGMMVLRSHWRLGIASHLLNLQDEFANNAGITRIEAYVRTLNTAGVALYKKHGYQIEGTRRRAALIDGQYVDEYYIAKLF